jgi:carboxypeptidase T
MVKIATSFCLMILFASAFLGKATMRSASPTIRMEECSPTFLPPIDWNHYHNYSEVVAIVLALNETYPGIVDVFSIGKSIQNRDIYCVRLTNETDHKLKPEVFFVGCHHASEVISLEVCLYFTVYAVTNFGSNATITSLLNKCEIFVVVALNVDGIDLFQLYDYQRRNARPIDDDKDGRFDEDPPEDVNGNGLIEDLWNVTDPLNWQWIATEGIDNDGDGQNGEDMVGGVDLNRNYDYGWEHAPTGGEQYRGASPFSEPETSAIRDFVIGHHFAYAISFHSGQEAILYPWGTTSAAPPDEAKFIEVCQDLSNLTDGTSYSQSGRPFPIYGTWDDWMYGVEHVLALTCEIFANNTWEGPRYPGPLPNTTWMSYGKYGFNPQPHKIETVIQRWLPVFFYITNRAINETPKRTRTGHGGPGRQAFKT